MLFLLKNAFFFLLFALACGPVFSQTNAAPPNPVLLSIGGKPLTVSEFLQNYQRHQYDADSSGASQSPRQYLDAFIAYKLKVRAAEARGYDTTQAFREELATYRQQSLTSFLTDKAATEALIREAYERMKTEINAAHILLAVAPNAPPADTLAAYRQALDLRERALRGESFGALAKTFSKDPSASQNEGNLGWFSALQMVYPVENAAYTTDRGRISMPVRTQFGYHLVRVADRREAQGKVKVAHVFARLSPEATQPEQVAAKNKIDEAYAALGRGEPFERVVKQYSDDATTRNSGGVLAPFGTGAMVAAFENAAFALKKAGSYSAPFQTTYGWHIVRLVEKLPLEPFEQLSGVVRQKVLADGRSALSRQTTLVRLKRENKFAENAPVLAEALAAADARLAQGQWKADSTAPLATKPLFTLGSTAVPVSDFFDFVQKRQQAQPGAEASALMRSYFEQFSEQRIFAYEEAHLEEKNAEFRALVQEFHDGILLFQVMETDVLNKSLSDSTGQRAFYEKTKTTYRQPERAVATILSAANPDVLEQARRLLAKQPYALNRRVPDLYFEKGKTSITEAQREQLFDLVVIMARNPGYQVEISGNADTSEEDSTSHARAQNVVRYLTGGGGIALTRIIEIDEGKFKPASKTDRDKNRRVGFVFFTTSKQDVAARFNQQKSDNLIVTEGAFKRGDDKLLDAVPWKPGRQMLEKGGRAVQIDIARIEPARPKTFAEARGAVINAYQAQLERDWLLGLRQQFPVVLNDEEVRKLK